MRGRNFLSLSKKTDNKGILMPLVSTLLCIQTILSTCVTARLSQYCMRAFFRNTTHSRLPYNYDDSYCYNLLLIIYNNASPKKHCIRCQHPAPRYRRNDPWSFASDESAVRSKILKHNSQKFKEKY